MNGEEARLRAFKDMAQMLPKAIHSTNNTHVSRRVGE
jgi:hypothetical protein